MKRVESHVVELNAKLLKCVEKHNEIYDAGCPRYAVKQFTDQAWEQIAEELGIDVKDCKCRWRNIRISYLRYLRMQNNPEKRTKPYYLLDEISFMEKHVRTSDSFNNTTLNSSNVGRKRKFKKEEPLQVVTKVDPDTNASIVYRIAEEEDPIEYQREDEFLTFVDPDEPEEEQPPEIDMTNTSINMNISKLLLELSNHDMGFLRSLYPDMARLTPGQKSKFKFTVLQALNEILYKE